MLDIDSSVLKYDDKGLIPAIAQDSATGVVLMLAYMNKEAVDLTVQTGKVHYYSRSRQSIWLKGETSGHFQNVQTINYDCDKDALLLSVLQTGVACHTGHFSCFGDTGVKTSILYRLAHIIAEREKNPQEGSYTNYLLDTGIDKILKKIGEESAELIIATKNDDAHEIIYEAADLLYHLSVLLHDKDISYDSVFDELLQRELKRELSRVKNKQ